VDRFISRAARPRIIECRAADVVASTNASVGVPLVGMERDALMAIAADDAYRAHRAFTTAKTQVDQLAAASPTKNNVNPGKHELQFRLWQLAHTFSQFRLVECHDLRDVRHGFLG
jgi:hypothetical protein